MTSREVIKKGDLALAALVLPFPLATFEKHHDMTDSKVFEVIVVGGSYAGLSAAMALGRSLRKVLVIDSGLPCNGQTPHSHNFITQDGETPSAIIAKAKAQVLCYDTVSFVKGLVASAKRTEDGFEISTEGGEVFYTQKLIFSTGISDVMPDIRGFAACWGISVIHCPYCHGYEFRNRKTGVLANGARGFHIASLVNNLTDDMTMLTNGKADFDAEQVAKLKGYGIRIIESKVSALEHEDGLIRSVFFEDGDQMFFDVVYAVIPFVQHSDVPASLGCELTEQGYLKVDGFQKTSVEGVFACGDNAAMMRSVANAVYSGNLTGAVVNGELTNERF
jgi:thioredoxin reductase